MANQAEKDEFDRWRAWLKREVNAAADEASSLWELDCGCRVYLDGTLVTCPNHRPEDAATPA